MTGRALSDSVDGGLDAAYFRLRTAHDRDGGLTVDARRACLKSLRRHLVQSAEAYAAAVQRDFGIRSRHETLLTEVSIAIGAIDHALPRLARWSTPTRVPLKFPYWPARAHILKQPRGLVGVIGPSNYPIQLALTPLVGALSAGCRVLLKPSEATPATAALIQSGLAEAIDAEAVGVVTGGPDVAASLTRLPLDLILFTGSSEVGGKVLQAAADAKTPVVLELGGKSPAIFDISANLDAAATAVVAGKLLNAGQTCVAPDYLLVPRSRFDDAIEALRGAAARLFPNASDMTALLSDRAAARLSRLAEGHRQIPLLPFAVAPPLQPPILVLAPPLDSAIMREEIFGPLLPVLPYDSIDAAIAVIRALPHPLAIYWFGDTGASFDRLLSRTTSGTVAVNETVLHAGIHDLPFGGIGGSGMGRYHGKAGFDTFTHERPVFRQARWSFTGLMRPPYRKLADRILASLLR